MTRAKILSFGKLDKGWDFGQGVPAPKNVVSMALKLYGFGEQLGLNTDAFPGAGGDISVDYYIGEELVQVLIDTDLTLELTHERGIGSRYDELAYYDDISINKVFKYLFDFKAKGYASSWSSSGFCTEKSTKPSLSDFIAIALNHSMEEYPLLKWSVSATKKLKFMNTFYNIIPQRRMENRLPFGI
jgi:hypothetical protein